VAGPEALGIIVSSGGRHTGGVMPLSDVDPGRGGERVLKTFLTADMAGAVGALVERAARRKAKRESHEHRKGGKAHSRYARP
jgi:hypothetical protein